MNDIYFDYENNVLINKLGITDENKLKQAEADLTIIRLKEILSSNDFKNSKTYYLNLHKKMFDDIYPFAGRIRKIDIMKNERVLSFSPMLFTTYSKINNELSASFKKYNIDISILNKEEITTYLRNYMTSIWTIHPFREGNTRTIITFIIKYLKSKNMSIDENLLIDNFSYVRDSLVMSAYNTPEYLDKILFDLIERGKSL